ncbi:endonuclease [Bifidobacterium goeldii]|uniref:Endonuclease n=1 Tax=Bifidobacterium goeldii TaxID=2306975 RepID=A0A430FL37_9BIFI|nr:endonuclease/exonuclease/phosphatase family protein [Bifidobacterium goeldii]RSX53500.1 endonuclease [Bifidobacterium goeldii]
MVWFSWILLLICLLWLALRWLPAGSEARMPFPYMLALASFLWIPLAIIAVWACIAGMWGQFWVALGGLLTVCESQLPYWLGVLRRRSRERVQSRNGDRQTNRETSRETQDDSRGTSHETVLNPSDAPQSLPSAVNVMTLNCRFGRADAAAIIAAVREHDITVLALQELSADLVAALDAQGLASLLPYRQLGEARDSDNGGFNGVWTRISPVNSVTSIVNIPAADVPAISLEYAAANSPAQVNAPARGRVTFASAHPKSPMRGCREWSAGIIGLGAIADSAAHSDHDIAVVLGDLNSSIDHPSFRALLRHGFIDANLYEGRGPRFTFPRWLIWPRIVLDHVLATRGASFSHVRSFVVPGTDHLALTATIELSD